MAAGNHFALPGSYLKDTMNINELEALADQIAGAWRVRAGSRGTRKMSKTPC